MPLLDPAARRAYDAQYSKTPVGRAGDIASNDRRYRRVKVDLRALKLLRSCVDCGYDKNANALQFDHVRGTKYRPVTNLWKAPGLMAREIAKCEVRCANCHAIATEARRPQGRSS